MNDRARHLPVNAVPENRTSGAFEFELLNRFQRDFPLAERPYAAIAACLGAEERDVIAAYARLAESGAVSRIGAVFRPGAVGASALAAMRVPPEDLEAVAARISAHAEVSHNYERNHDFNLWFVAGAADSRALDLLFASIRAFTGYEVLPLPLIEEYHVDLGFDLAASAAYRPPRHRGAARPTRPVAVDLDESERHLVAAMQEGLALVSRPYERLATRAGMTEREVIDAIARWTEQGIIRRWGVVVRHRELGYRANAMAVWNVPDTTVAEVGMRLAREPRVTLAYRRARHRPQWDYNLYCMIHGRERDEVERVASAVARSAGVDDYPHALLFSRRRFKQSGARMYARLGGTETWMRSTG